MKLNDYMLCTTKLANLFEYPTMIFLNFFLLSSIYFGLLFSMMRQNLLFGLGTND